MRATQIIKTLLSLCFLSCISQVQAEYVNYALQDNGGNATQSCSNHQDKPAELGIDLDPTTNFHTCKATEVWWQVELGVRTLVDHITINNNFTYNTHEEEIDPVVLQLYDGEVKVAEKALSGIWKPVGDGNGTATNKVFSIDFDNVVATKVKLYKNTPENDDSMHLKEVEAWGTPFVNYALESNGGEASQSCTYSNSGAGDPVNGIDGDTSSDLATLAHTCNDANIDVSWEVELGVRTSVDHITIFNRVGVYDHRERMEPVILQLYDGEVEVDSKPLSGIWQNSDVSADGTAENDVFTVEFDNVVATKVRLFRPPADQSTTEPEPINFRELEAWGTFAPVTASPTKAPTASPTSSPAPPGSFEIHSTAEVTGTATSGTAIRLTAPYNASNRVHRTTVLSPDCINDFTGTAKEAFQVEDTEDVSLGDGYISYNSTIDIDISKVNNTEWWKALSSGALGGVLDLCLESAVYYDLPDGTNETMNFVNTNLTLTVEMDANFEVTSIDAERKDATQEKLTLDYSQYVTAYQCTAADLETEITGEYSQGDELKICVTSTEPSIVQVGSMKSLTLSQAGSGAGAGGDDFAYITGGVVANDEIAATDCDTSTTPAHVCHADMQLLGRYFTVNEPGDLTASGSVELDFSSGRRLTVDVPIAGGIRGGNLALENSARRMEDKPEESAFAGVKASLKSLDGSGSDYYGASLLSGLVAAAAGGAILMV